MQSTQYLVRNATAVKIGQARDLATFSTVGEADEFAREMLKDGRYCYYVGGSSHAISFIATAEEREKMGVDLG